MFDEPLPHPLIPSIPPSAATANNAPSNAPNFRRRGTSSSTTQASPAPEPAYQALPIAFAGVAESGPTCLNRNLPVAPAAALFGTYADRSSVVVPAAVEVITTGSTVKLAEAFSVLLVVPAINVTEPVNPFTGVTVNTSPDASVPAAVVTVAAAGVSEKSAAVAETTSIDTDPFDPEYTESPV
jgi:hypothetical protein